MNDRTDIFDRLCKLSDDPAIQNLTPEQIAALLAELRRPARAADPTGSRAQRRRWQDELIEALIPAGASVLDLGCGSGDLLARLIQNKSVRSQGVEQDPAAVFDCVARGVPVLQANLDEGLRGFADQSFDYVVLEETLQTLYRPVDMLREMLRVGRHGIVSFPNFAHWRVRLDLLLRGRMPTTPRLPHQWHDTPNIHLLSLQDFLDWADADGVRIVAAHALVDETVRPLADGDNLHAEEVLLVVQRP